MSRAQKNVLGRSARLAATERGRETRGSWEAPSGHAVSDPVRFEWGVQGHAVRARPTEVLPVLMKRYAVEDPRACMAALEAHPELSDLLMEASQEIRVFFPDVHYLRLRSDRELAHELIVDIVLSEDADPFERLEAFDQTWWFDACERADHALTITLAFQ